MARGRPSIVMFCSWVVELFNIMSRTSGKRDMCTTHKTHMGQKKRPRHWCTFNYCTLTSKSKISHPFTGLNSLMGFMSSTQRRPAAYVADEIDLSSTSIPSSRYSKGSGRYDRDRDDDEYDGIPLCASFHEPGSFSSSHNEDNAVVYQHQNDVFKRLVVCGHYHRKVAEELQASQIIETREKRWTSTLNERDYLDLVEQAVVSFDKACVHSGILVQYGRMVFVLIV